MPCRDLPPLPQLRRYGDGVGGYTPTEAVGSDGTEVRPQFPGATASWTHELEFVNADKGLGYLIVSATAFFRTPVAFGALILLSVLGVALFQLVVIVERIFFPWSAESDETVIV